ncbi:MAG: hypothetical protein KAG86_07660, partial [Gammaproteobacteria bacterium]|nr:hypothetical protein [Gammaproteobacteria bacterium]
MKNILTILIFLLFLTSPLRVQYTQTGLQFQREVLGKELCEDDDEDCKEDEDEDEDGDDDKDDDSEEDDEKDDDDKNNGESENISPAS